MKIIRIIARLNVGGPARHVIWLTQALQDAEFSSQLVAGRVPEGEEDMAYIADAHDVRPVFIEEMSRELSINDISSLVKILRLFLREKPHIVHTHTAKAGTIGRTAALLYRWLTPSALIGRPRRLAVVHTFHGHVFHSYYGKTKTRFFVLIEKVLARLATDKIIVISDQQFNEIYRQVGIGSEAQFEVIPLGIDLGAFDETASKTDRLRGELSIGRSTLLVGSVGRLTEVKNLPLYLRVAKGFEALNDPTMPSAHFVIAGDGGLRSALEAEARELGLSRITFLGNRRDIEEVYAGLDIAALTSLNEGTPLSLIEAMASRKPIIATTVGGVADLLGCNLETHDGFSVCERGIGIDPGNAAAFLNGLIYLAKNERLRKDLSDRAYEFVQARYGKERLIGDIRQLYRELHKSAGFEGQA